MSSRLTITEVASDSQSRSIRRRSGKDSIIIQAGLNGCVQISSYLFARWLERLVRTRIIFSGAFIGRLRTIFSEKLGRSTKFSSSSEVARRYSVLLFATSRFISSYCLPRLNDSFVTKGFCSSDNFV